MKQSSVEEGILKITKFPLITFEYTPDDEDCDSSTSCDDITEKELAILAKLQAEAKEKKEEMSDNENISEKENVGEDSRTERDGERKGSNQKNDPEVNSEAVSPNVRSRRKPCHKKSDKNPFHKDRLALSSCLPLPPPFPPPQLHPPIDEFEEIECPTHKKSKPCGKKPVNLTGTKADKKLKQYEDKKYVEEAEHEDSEEQSFLQETEELDQDLNETEKKEKSVEDENTEGGIEGIEEREGREGKEGKEGREGREGREGEGKLLIQNEENKDMSKRKPCIKWEQPPCKKKVSEISISLLPPRIPPLQRDLPSISPRNTPEMERQILMAEEAKKKHCKNKGKKTK